MTKFGATTSNFGAIGKIQPSKSGSKNCFDNPILKITSTNPLEKFKYPLPKYQSKKVIF